MIEAFKKAVAGGDVGEARRLLETSVEVRGAVNAPLFAFDQRPVSRAAKDFGMVDLLLEFGADLNLKSEWWAGGWGILETAEPELAEELIKRGAVVDVFAAAHLDKIDRLRELLDADPELVHAKGGDGCRALHFARSKEAMDLLLSRGAEIDARDVDHEGTAAQWAVPRADGSRDDKWREDLQRVRWLVERGATVDIFMAAVLGDSGLLRKVMAGDPGAADVVLGETDYALCPKAPGEHIYTYRFTGGMTPYQVAMEFGNPACAEILLESATPRQRFLAACSVGDEGAARAVLVARPGVLGELTGKDRHVLAHAAWAGRVAAVMLMLDMGIDPAVKGPGESTALHRAAWRGHHAVVRTILTHPVAKGRLKELVSAVEASFKATPLGWCYHGSTNCGNPAGDYAAIARMLLEAGAEREDASGASEAVRAAVG